MQFAKYQGAGNDFVLLAATEAPPDWPALARRLCDRHFGVGGDGLLLLDEAGGQLRMRMFNPDGTEDMCGNGLRCLAFHAHRLGLTSGDAFVIETLAGPRRCRLLEAEAHRAVVWTEMGRADLRPEAVPMKFPGAQAVNYPLKVGGETLTATSLSTGTAHTVIFGPPPDEARFQRLSPLIETHALFPERTSVLWAEPLSRSRLRVRIWERAVGETLACGTDAAAVAVAARVQGLADSPVEIVSAGGTLAVEVAEDLAVALSGPAVHLYDGAVTLE